MEYILQMLGLPLQTLAVLASGYISYRWAYTGKDNTHKTLDVVFIIFVFAFVSKLAISGFSHLLTQIEVSGYALEILPLLIGMLAALCTASLWSRWGKYLIRKLLRNGKISNSDRSVTAWDAIRSDATLIPSQLMVRRKDGVTLMCNNLCLFEDNNPGPCIYGTDGSIALYVTDQMGDDGKWETIEVNDPVMGDMMTFVPAAEVQMIYVRH
jgi:hypothetical protein